MYYKVWKFSNVVIPRLEPHRDTRFHDQKYGGLQPDPLVATVSGNTSPLMTES